MVLVFVIVFVFVAAERAPLLLARPKIKIVYSGKSVNVYVFVIVFVQTLSVYLRHFGSNSCIFALFALISQYRSRRQGSWVGDDIIEKAFT